MTGILYPIGSILGFGFHFSFRLRLILYYSLRLFSINERTSLVHFCELNRANIFVLKLARTRVMELYRLRHFLANMIAETCIDHVAAFLERDSVEIREMNIYRGGEVTHYNQIMNPGIRRCWEKCMEKSSYYEKKRKIEQFNGKSRWKKRAVFHHTSQLWYWIRS